MYKLTSDNSIVGGFNNRTVKLDDVSMTEDAEDFSLSNKPKHILL